MPIINGFKHIGNALKRDTKEDRKFDEVYSKGTSPKNMLSYAIKKTSHVCISHPWHQ